MNTMYNMLVLYPEHLNLNGDVANAGILARRMNWYGLSAAIEFHNPGDQLPNYVPDFVLLGHGSEAAWAALEQDLQDIWPQLHNWLESGIAGLAVNSGQELLHADPFKFFDGQLTATERSSQFVAEPATYHDATGEILGYRNTVFDSPVLEVKGSFVGTALHGPVLAKNAWLADAMIRQISGQPELSASQTAQEQLDAIGRLEAGIRELEVALANE